VAHHPALFLRLLPASLIISGLACAFIAAVTRVSLRKGTLRLLASLLVSAAFVAGASIQIANEDKVWPDSFGVGAGLFLTWIGWRKYRKDPTGTTPASRMLEVTIRSAESATMPLTLREHRFTDTGTFSRPNPRICWRMMGWTVLSAHA
jgi:hypothetical protein